MEIVKIPKKFRDILDILRSGQIENGLEQLEKIKDFEPQKAIVLAEINYFSENYEMAMTNDEMALPYDEQWYAGNILFEHFVAYTNTALISNNISRAENFYKQYLTEKEKLSLPDHRLNTYRYQIQQQLAKLKGDKNLKINVEPLKVIREGKSTDYFIELLKENRPKLTYESAKGAEYLLHFMFERANTDESLAYYEKYENGIISEHIHIGATRLFLAKNQIEKAKNALMTYVTKSWYPVEYIQITPMRIWEYEDLYPILTKDLKKGILLANKAKR